MKFYGNSIVIASLDKQSIREMMNKAVFIFLLLLCNTLAAQVHNEKLIFEIRFGFIKGGEAIYQSNETRENYCEEIHSMLHVYTTGFANKIYEVDDCFESFLSKDNLLPNKSIKVLKEQKFRFEEEVKFDQEKEVAFINKSGCQGIKRGICDVSSLMYYLRYSGKLDNLKLNQIIEIPFWDTAEWYMLKIKYTGIEKIKTSLGKTECLRLEPQEVAGRFFNKRNPMNIWVTNDTNKLPVLMELNFTIGSVKCEQINPPPTP
jgi:hypothetical protein